MKPTSWNWLALLIWPPVAYALAWQAAPLGGTRWSAAVGAILGVLLQRRLQSAPLRLPAVWLLTLGGLLGLTQLRSLLLWVNLPSQLLGVDRVFLWSQNLTWLGGWALALLALRLTSARWHSAIALEGGLAAMSIIWILSGHRQGFINRPFFLVDPLWGQGIDPLPVFLGLGVVSAVLVGSLAASHHKGRRPVWDIVFFLLVLVGVYLLIPPSSVKEWGEKYGMGDGTGKERRYSEKDKDSDKKQKGGSKMHDGRPHSGQSPGSQNQPSSGTPTPQDQGQGEQRQEPDFGNQQQPQQNPPVAVVIFRDDYTPESGYYYFRQNAFSEYNGIKLIRTSDGEYDRDIAENFPTYSFKERPLGDTVGMIAPSYDESAFIRIPSRVALMSQINRPFGLSNPARFWSCDNPDPKRFQKAYEVESLALTLPYKRMVGRRAGDKNWSKAAWVHYTLGPKDKRYRELADTILNAKPEFKKNDFFKAVAIKLWLDENTTYSLDSRHQSSRDPVGDFLFGDRTGYCVFTSHSACYLFRSVGIPARIAEGYAVPATSKGGGSTLLIRSREAHSWPEIYLDGLGWMALDIAPKKTLVPPEDPVDNGLQQMLGDMARKDDEHQAPDQPKQTIDVQKLLKELFRQMAIALPWSLLLTLLFLFGVKFYRRLCPHWPWTSAETLAIQGFRSVLDRLADRGRVRKPGTSREQFAREQSDLCPGLFKLTRLHLATRLGQRPVAREELESALLTATMELNRHKRSWSDWLRLFNPVSWWSVN